MAYNQGGAQGYGSYNPYGQANPYQQGNDYAQQGAYGSQQPNPYAQQQNPYSRPAAQQQAGPRFDEERAQGGYEMTSMNGRSNDPNRILNDVRNLDRTLDEVDRDLQRLSGLRSSFLRDVDTSSQNPIRGEIDRLNESIMTKYRSVVSRVKQLKQDPESGNPRNAPQVGKIDRRTKAAINQFQHLESEFRKQCQEQMARQYRIVRPDASEQEVREAVEDTNNTQIFSQAIISSNRRGEATAAAQNVRSRHEAIQKIERDIMELAQMFNDLEAAVVQQEAAVTNIEEKADDTRQHVVKANTELDGAVDKARAARRKKWICLGIVVLIIIIIIVVVAVVVEVTKH